jgi:Cu(I)/Ag(I) efflux system membrane fusion protein
MKADKAVWLLLVVIAAGLGYWLGGRHDGGTQETSGGAAGSRRILYYRNPMGQPDTSPVPKKDSMGMDYIPVYDGDAPAAEGIAVSADRVQSLGVRTEAVGRRVLDVGLRTPGRVEVDERRVHVIAPRFEGWVERLHVNAGGQPVARGQPLFEVYSPELLSLQREYALAVRGAAAIGDADGRAAMTRLAEAALQRLRNWEISDEQVRQLAAGGEPRRTLTVHSPVSGIVSDKKVVQGMRFSPGDTLFEVTDISSVWVIADVSEQDLGRVHVGGEARVSVAAWPGRTFTGKVSYVYPKLIADTRTVPVRIELANPDGALKPAMVAQVQLTGASQAAVLAVAESAVIDSGERQVVMVRTADGRFAPRDVRLGRRDGSYVEVLDGVREGELVVSSGNFLLDAESNLKAALQGFAGGTQAPAAAVAYRTHGVIVSFDAAAGTAMIRHQPIAELKWPAMTMEFLLANRGLAEGLKEGMAVDFEFVERAPGEWVVTRIDGGKR